MDLRSLFTASVVSFAFAAGVTGTTTLLAKPAQARPSCNCPTNCPGIICLDTLNFYCNRCQAACDGAHRCGLAG